MARHVIKLGSGIVAHDDGSLRAEALAAICDEVAVRRRAGDDVVIVSSG
ncbi:MAG: glutamate 5-kinase, partial [Baekduia sp.]|nr:glutamate 5-kinase [Baekduia sp.]